MARMFTTLIIGLIAGPAVFRQKYLPPSSLHWKHEQDSQT